MHRLRCSNICAIPGMYLTLNKCVSAAWYYKIHNIITIIYTYITVYDITYTYCHIMVIIIIILLLYYFHFFLTPDAASLTCTHIARTFTVYLHHTRPTVDRPLQSLACVRQQISQIIFLQFALARTPAHTFSYAYII